MQNYYNLVTTDLPHFHKIDVTEKYYEERPLYYQFYVKNMKIKSTIRKWRKRVDRGEQYLSPTAKLMKNLLHKTGR